MSRKSTAQRAAEAAPLPQRNWSQLFGYDAVFASMLALIQSGRWPQAVLLEGRSGIGKKTLLARIAAGFFCETKSACGHCAGCRGVTHGYHPDLLWIEADGPIKVSDADQIQEHLSYEGGSTGTGRASRIVVVTDIEELTEQAANRLLKTLEEPPPNARILLSCSRPRQLLPTILSRLVRWQLSVPDPELSLAWLSARAAERGFAIDPAQLRAALQSFANSPGQAWHFIEQEQGGLGTALDSLEKILLGPFDGSQLGNLQELIKQQGWKADELAQILERLLNRSYRAQLGLGPSGVSKPSSFTQRQQWRRILRQVYRAGGRGHNYLNTQMVAEALLGG